MVTLSLLGDKSTWLVCFRQLYSQSLHSEQHCSWFTNLTRLFFSHMRMWPLAMSWPVIHNISTWRKIKVQEVGGTHTMINSCLDARCCGYFFPIGCDLSWTHLTVFFHEHTWLFLLEHVQLTYFRKDKFTYIKIWYFIFWQTLFSFLFWLNYYQLILQLIKCLVLMLNRVVYSLGNASVESLIKHAKDR